MKRKTLPGSSSDDLKNTGNHDQQTTTDSGSKRKLDRRGFLKAGAGAAAAALTIPVESLAQTKLQSLAQTKPAVPGECFVPFDQPDPVSPGMIDAQNNVIPFKLSAEPLDWTVTCPGKPSVKTRQPAYNGALPGPTFVAKPGTMMDVRLFNNLGTLTFSQDNCTPDGHHTDPTKPACFTHTNLHFHGLQVSPCSVKSDDKVKCEGTYAINGKNPPLKYSSDDVLVDIFAGQSNDYHVAIPDMHAPGTNWYHSHLHGASAYQVSGGMAGAIIIPEPPGAQIVQQDLDKLFILQEIQPNDPNNWPAYPAVYGALGGTGGRPRSQVFVNGLCRPTLTMKARQTMRFRFINTTATPNGLMTLRLIKTATCSPDFPNPAPPLTAGEVMFLIAVDGLSFYGINPQPVRYHIMGSGNRADFLVNLEPGYYTLLKDRFPLKSVSDPSSGQTSFTQASDRSKQVLMYFDVQDNTTYKEDIPRDVPKIPGNKPAYLNPIVKVDVTRKDAIKFQNPSTGLFQIDGAVYDKNLPINVDLNTAEEWTLQNIGFPTPATPPQTNTHPFHVHLNPFQILGIPFDFEVTDADLKKFFPTIPRWKPEDPCGWPFWDTVPLPAQIPPQTGPPGELKIRSRFLIYNGEYVTHCHILVHEDVGMMIDVKLNDPKGQGIGPGQPVHDYPEPAKECIRRTSGCPGDTKV